jgi:glycine/D-amino acid oxidase-like deaminating enzyme
VTAGIIVRDEEFAKIQPYALARGLARVAERKGMQLYESTSVRSYTPTPHRVELTTNGGAKVCAKKLVLAVGSRIRDLAWPRFRLLPISIHSYLLATEPLDDKSFGRLGLGLASASVLDASPSFYYLRTYQRRLLIGGAGKLAWKADAAADHDVGQYQIVLAEMRRRFPFLSRELISAGWAGPIQSNLAELPTVTNLPNLPNVVVNIAYVNGVPLAYVAGRLVVDLVLGESFSDPDIVRLRKIFAGTRPSILQAARTGLSLFRPRLP